MSVLKKKTLWAGAIAALMAATSAFALDPGYRAPDADHTLVIDTTKGQVIVELYPAMAPLSAERLITLTRQKFYDGLIFHRVIEDFMAQTGDPQGTGMGGSTLPNVKGEFTMRHDASFPLTVAVRPKGSLIGFVGALPVQSQVNELMPISNDGKVMAWGLYCQGVLGMARDNSPDSANSQFFLMRGANAALEKRYTPVGVIISGLDVVRKLKIGEPPVNPDKMTSVRMLSDIPEAERPQVEIMDTTSPQFQTVLEAVRKDKGADFSACDVTIPSKILNAPAVATAETPATPPAK
jgi:peptidylprolyl isomerase